MSKLKPCPFCGSEAEIQDLNDGLCYRRKYRYRVKCQKCPCSFAFTFFKTKESAVDAWNTRTPKNDEVRR